MRVKTKHGPAYTVAYCVLEHREKVRVERGAMAWMSAGLDVSADTGGGVVSAALRAKLGKEGFFWATYTAEMAGAWVAVAPRAPGDIAVIELGAGQKVRSEQGALLAVSGSCTTSVRYSGLGAVLLREGVVVVETTGPGQAVIGSYGAIEPWELKGNEQLIVDTGHLVAWDEGVDVKATTIGGMKATALSGEGLVATVTGPGRVWLQTRAEVAFREWLFPDKSTG